MRPFSLQPWVRRPSADKPPASRTPAVVVVHLDVLVCGLDEHRPIAAVDEAVVELKAEERREDGGVSRAGILDDCGNSGLSIGLGVEPT